MSTAGVQCELMVFPTELAMRQYQQKQALKNGWVDASGHTSFARIRKRCIPYANLKARPISGAKEMLLRRQVVDVARGHFSGQGSLAKLSASALEEVIDQLLAELSMLPDESTRIVNWMLDHPRHHKLYELGTLFSIWRVVLKQEGYADRINVNLAILKLLRGDRDHWPPFLRDARRVTFRSVRWFNPFEEACVTALNHTLKVQVESALPPAHAEAAADRMGLQIRSDSMAQPWADWTEDLGDALAVDSPDVLQQSDSCRIDFSRSAGAYGEIEDLARRICWNLETKEMPANRIALVVANVGTVQDIIPHVFSRFRIPYFFRRGRPVLSSPCVKAFLAWLSFPLRPERDTLMDLIRNPAIRMEQREEAVEELLKKQTPPRINLQKIPWLNVPSTCSGHQIAELLAERMVEPEDHFNTEALKQVTSILEEIGDHPLPLGEMIELTESLLKDATVKPRDSHEQGVWILNPHDAVGLEFDLVLFAGLNEGEFPSVPQQDALLSDSERYRLRRSLEEQGRQLPGMALPDTATKFERETVLFLSALGMAREQLVFSCQSVDQEGHEKSESDYYRRLWNLSGWGVQPDIRLSPYDQWRVERLGAQSVFADHWKLQQTTPAEERLPMPGESFLPVVPLSLCRAGDEALQAAVQSRLESGNTKEGQVVPAAIEHLVAMLEIEAERDTYLNTPLNERKGSVYCGHIEAFKQPIADWFDRREELSPTALETLAQCRYIFLLEKVFGLKEQRVADDTPDPLDRGTLIHSILKEIYTAIAVGEAGVDAPRYWAVHTFGGWKKTTAVEAGALPLATFVPEQRSAYEAFAKKVAVSRLEEAELGHPGVWTAERKKILEQVLNFIRYDVETCSDENRFPVLFEHTFGGETALDLGAVKVRGKIDRVDLLFSDAGALNMIRVLDYKGPSRARNSKDEYIAEILHNLDCQLPIYGFAAQQHILGAFNTAETNAMTEAGYLFYQREEKEVGKTLKKSLLSMDEDGLVTGFMATLVGNIERMKNGDFAVDPLIEGYTDYQSICRVDSLQADELCDNIAARPA